MTHIGRMLRLYRAAHNVEQQALAERIGIDARQLGRLELAMADAETLAKVLVWMLDSDPLPVSSQAPVPLTGGKAVAS